MKSLKMSLALVALMAVTGFAYVAQQAETSGPAWCRRPRPSSARSTPNKRSKRLSTSTTRNASTGTSFRLQDKKTRKYTRKGLPLEEMSAEQKKAALALVKAGTSESGNMAVDDHHEPGSNPARTGRPQERDGPQSRLVLLHRLRHAVEDRQMGLARRRASPVDELHDGRHAGRLLHAVLLRRQPGRGQGRPERANASCRKRRISRVNLFKSLDDDQKKIAHQDKHFGEPGALMKQPKVGKPVGLAAKDMKGSQKEMLPSSSRATRSACRADIAALEMKQVKDGGLDNVYFAFTGSTEAGKGFTYRVQGPTFVVEFLNIQADSGKNPNNHIHSCWRRIKGDFGL